MANPEVRYQVLVVVVESTEKALIDVVNRGVGWGILGRNDYTFEEALGVIQNAEEAYRDD